MGSSNRPAPSRVRRLARIRRLARVRRLATVFVLFCAFWAFPTAPAHAYLDPGSGTMIIQIVIATVAGAGMVIKVYWHRLKNLFSDPAKKKEHPSE